MNAILSTYLRWGLPDIGYPDAVIQHSARSKDEPGKYNVIFEYKMPVKKGHVVIKNIGIEIDALDLLLFTQGIKRAS